jgi:hypothetical protein
MCGGLSCRDACDNCNITQVWQESPFFSQTGQKYRTQSNCQSSTCDWSWFVRFFEDNRECFNTDFTCGGGIFVGPCSTYSDVTLKHGIETLKNVLDSIMKIEAVEYDWNENLNPTLLDYFKKQQKLHTIGLIAQNVRLYFPEAVRMGGDGYYSIDYHKLNAVLVEGIKEQQIFIEDIDKQLEYIESKIK